MDDLDDELPRGDALQDFLSYSPLLYIFNKLFDDFVVNIGVEQNAANLAQRFGNVRL